jgi:uncharacterized protein YndB with AHSA1/START domain
MEIRKEYTIGAPQDAVWSALTDPSVIDHWGGGPSTIEPVPGAEFSMWGGDIHGTVTAADPGHSMTQEWYSGDWRAPSIAQITLSDGPGGGTRVELDHMGVPENEAAEIATGWDDYYFGPLTRMLEEGESWA